MDKVTEQHLQESFFNHLSSYLGEKEDIDNMLMRQRLSDDENSIIQYICEEIDMEHELMADLANSGLDPGEWFEKEIEKTTKELFPNATAEDLETVKDEVKERMVKDIELEAKSLKKEISSLDKQEIPEENDVTETTESEVIDNLLNDQEEIYE